MKFIDDFIVGIAIYAVMFWGLFECGGGGFLVIGSVLMVLFAIYHCIFCSIVKFQSYWKHQFSFLLIPSWVVVYEYSRHLVAYSYDESGLTFALIGQFTPTVITRSLAAIGGIWLLSFVMAFLIWLVVFFFNHRQRRYVQAISLCGLAALPWVFIAKNRFDHACSWDAHNWLVTIPFPISSISAPAVFEFVAEADSFEKESPIVVLGSETILAIKMEGGEIEFDRPEDELWQDLSTRANRSVVVGAWILMDGREDRINAIVQFSEGEVVGVAAKHRLAPFVESQPPGTKSLISLGWLPDDAVRNATPPDVAEKLLADVPKPHGVQTGVCYDIFFGSAYLDGLNESHEFMTCSLDETYDDSGIFQWLSMQHSRIRAIEARRSLVRCSLGGITAAFDPLGNEIQPIVSRAGMNLYRVPVCRESTFYSRTGDWIVWFSYIVVVSWMLHGEYERRRQRRQVDVV